MIDSIAAPGLFAGPTPSAPGSLGRNGFLKLLVTQLRNQDPLSPLKAHEFAAQLAQFTSVEQLTQINEGLAIQSGLIQISAMMNETSFGAALIGREVLAEGAQVAIPASGAGQVRVEVGAPGGHATLRLLDASGREMATRDLGNLPGGRQTITLPADLPPGVYRYELTVKGSDDTTIPVTHYTAGVVDGVSFKNGSVILRIGGLEILMEDLAEIGSFTGSTTGHP